MIGKLISSAGFLSSGGTIGGDLTISGDLTVSGGGDFAYSEVLTGDMKITNTAGTVGLTIDQDGANYGIEVDCEAANYAAVYVTGKYGIDCVQDVSSGFSARFSRNIAEAGSLSCVEIKDDHPSNTQTTLKVQQDGTGDILNLFDGTTEVFTVLDGGNVGIGIVVPTAVLHVDQQTTSGVGFKVTRDLAFGGTTDVLVSFTNDNRLDEQHLFTIKQDGYGRVIDLDISNTQTTNTQDPAIYMDYDKSGVVADGSSVDIFGLDFDIDDAATNHANATVTITGGRINVASANNQGTTKNVGLDVTVGGADTNYAALFTNTTTSSATQGASIRLSSKDGAAVTGDNHRLGVIDFAGEEDTSGTLKVAAQIEAFADAAFSATGDYGHAGRLEFAVQSSVTGTDQLAVPAMILDANSRISLSNNDSGGTGGSDSTSGNTIFGYLAGAAIASGALENTIIGHNSGEALTTGIENTLVGGKAGLALTIGKYNTAIGNWALITEDVGDRSTAIGTYALGLQNSDSNNEITGNVGVGMNAGYYNVTGQNNTYVGYQSGYGASGQSNSNNTAVGRDAMLAVTTGSSNVVIGVAAGDASLTSDECVFIGAGAGGATTAVDYAVIIGSGAGAANMTTAADGTVAIGRTAGAAITAPTHSEENTLVGINTGKLLTVGDGNVAVGGFALDAEVTGHKSTAVGYNALSAQVNSGDVDTFNTAVGYQSGDVITTGVQNTIIGSASDPSALGGANQTVIGYGTTGQSDNSVTLGNASVLNVYASQDGGAHVHCSGVSFPGTQAASGGANVLDDYEEGTWTPVLSDGSNNASSYGTQAGLYTKVGRQVTCTGRVTTTNIGAIDGDVRITGLPFTIKNALGGYFSVGVGHSTGFTITAGHSVALTGEVGATYVVINLWDDATGTTNMQHDEWTADGGISFTFTYFE